MHELYHKKVDLKTADISYNPSIYKTFNMVGIPIEAGRYRFLLHKWGLTPQEEQDLFTESTDILATDLIHRYRINSSISLTQENADLSIQVQLLAGELADRYIQLVKSIVRKYQIHNRSAPLTSLAEKRARPEISLYDGISGSHLLAETCNNHAKLRPIFRTVDINPSNILLIFNPPVQLATAWEMSDTSFHLQIQRGFWQIMHNLGIEFNLSFRRLNYRKTHIENEIYYALEFSTCPFADES